MKKRFVVLHELPLSSLLLPTHQLHHKKSSPACTIDNKPFKTSAGGGSVLTFCFFLHKALNLTPNNAQHPATLTQMASALPCCMLTGVNQPLGSGRARSTLNRVRCDWQMSKRGQRGWGKCKRSPF